MLDANIVTAGLEDFKNSRQFTAAQKMIGAAYCPTYDKWTRWIEGISFQVIAVHAKFVTPCHLNCRRLQGHSFCMTRCASGERVDYYKYVVVYECRVTSNKTFTANGQNYDKNSLIGATYFFQER
jgi:hypothetical protein